MESAILPEFGSLGSFVIFLCGIASHYFGRYLAWLGQGQWLLWANMVVGLAVSLLSVANGLFMLPDWAFLSILEEGLSFNGKEMIASVLIAFWPIGSIWLGGYWSIQHLRRLRYRKTVPLDNPK
ncbi:hypothetical protein [Hwanghaeella sp.]|uniref:hypothetical protein n=1 Tax=Hwanghaeella sp. TaxID=2605943 RepID=UPI003CCB932A